MDKRVRHPTSKARYNQELDEQATKRAKAAEERLAEKGSKYVPQQAKTIAEIMAEEKSKGSFPLGHPDNSRVGAIQSTRPLQPLPGGRRRTRRRKIHKRRKTRKH